MTWRLVEACAGTAALTFALFDLKPPVPMAGSKRTLAKQLRPFFPDGPPSEVHLNDPGEWGRTLSILLVTRAWEDVAQVFDRWGTEDQRELYDRLRTTPPASCPTERAATHLYLQTRTYRAKPVYPSGTGWVTHGFDPEYRLAKSMSPGAKSRGWFNSRPVLAQKLRDLAGYWNASPVRVTVTQLPLTQLTVDPTDIVFVDPPYAGSAVTYADRLPREEVLQWVQRRAQQGAPPNTTIVSEAEPLPGAARAAQLTTRRLGTQLGVGQEWVSVF